MKSPRKSRPHDLHLLFEAVQPVYPPFHGGENPLRDSRDTAQLSASCRFPTAKTPYCIVSGMRRE